MTQTAKLTKRQIASRHIHRRLQVQFAIFGAATLLILSITIGDMLHEQMSVLWAVGSLLFGVVVGLLVGRIFAIKWHEDTQKVILTMDKSSFLLIGAYIVFRVVSEQAFGSFFHGEELTIITFALLGGIMIGRVLSMYRSIVSILREQNIL